MEFSKVPGLPVPLWVSVLPADQSAHAAPLDQYDLRGIDPELAHCLYRAVSISRLPTVLASGIDVEPSDAVLYANCFEKAWEYGEFPKVMLALDHAGMERTFRQLKPDVPADELAIVKERFPHVETIDDGAVVWCSRIPVTDPRFGSAYEIEHAWWIPADPFQVLRAVFVFARPQDVEAVASSMRREADGAATVALPQD